MNMMRFPFQAIRRMSLDLTKSENPNKLIGPTFKHWMYAKAGYNQYGLMRDDCLDETPIVKEALRRLPPDLMDDRVFRIVRAGYLSMRNDVLPKEQWLKMEEDVKYLTPYIEEIEKEIAEKKAWELEE